jgi:hypothetical protein
MATKVTKMIDDEAERWVVIDGGGWVRRCGRI